MVKLFFTFLRDRILSELIVRKDGDLFELWREPPINPIMKVNIESSLGRRKWDNTENISYD